MAEIDIMKIPMIKSIGALCFLSAGLFPPFLFLWDINPLLFKEIDIFKLIILCGGFGLSFLTFCIIFAFFATAAIADPPLDKAMTGMPILAIGLSSFAYFILGIFTLIFNSLPLCAYIGTLFLTVIILTISFAWLMYRHYEKAKK
jgi:hypothetical protein